MAGKIEHNKMEIHAEGVISFFFFFFRSKLKMEDIKEVNKALKVLCITWIFWLNMHFT